MRFIGYIIAYDFQTLLRSLKHLVLSVGFMFMVISLLVFATGRAELPVDARLGVLLVSMVLAQLLSQRLIFEDDMESGMLEQFMLKQGMSETLFLAKALSHWLYAALPLLVLMPVGFFILNLPFHHLPDCWLALGMASLGLSFLIALGTALTLGEKQGQGLVTVIMFPFMVPLVVFALSAALPNELFLKDQTLSHYALATSILLIATTGSFLGGFALREAFR
jgi:heme exporter protein B